MGSNRIEVRQSQQQKLEARIAARKEALGKQGLTEAQQKKDKVLENLLADLKRTARAVASIKKMRGIVEAAHQKKIDAASKAAAEGPKKKKQAQAPVKEEKKEKKAKKAEKQEKAKA